MSTLYILYFTLLPWKQILLLLKPSSLCVNLLVLSKMFTSLYLSICSLVETYLMLFYLKVAQMHNIWVFLFCNRFFFCTISVKKVEKSRILKKDNHKAKQKSNNNKGLKEKTEIVWNSESGTERQQQKENKEGKKENMSMQRERMIWGCGALSEHVVKVRFSDAVIYADSDSDHFGRILDHLRTRLMWATSSLLRGKDRKPVF